MTKVATRWHKAPTFEEIAASTRQRPPHAKPIHRDALAYWDSFEASWLKLPFDELSAKATLIQNRDAVKQLAIAQARD